MSVHSREGSNQLFRNNRFLTASCVASSPTDAQQCPGPVPEVFRMRKTTLLCVVLGLMVSCSSEKKTASENPTQSSPEAAVKVAQYDTGRTAFQRAYLAAHGWAA